MPHPELSPPLIDAEGRIRTLLERADRFPVATRAQLPVVAVAPVDAVEGAGLWHRPFAWMATTRSLQVNRDLMLAFGLGFVVSAAVVMIGVAAKPIRIAVAPSVAVTEPSLASDSRTGAFAAPPLVQIAVAAATRPVEAAVANAAAAPVDNTVTIPAAAPASQRAQPRDADLPRHARLSTGVSPNAAGQFADVAAAPNLDMMTHAALPTPQDVATELIGIDGRPVATTQPRATVSPGPEEIAIEVPVPVRVTRPTPTPAFSAPAPAAPVAAIRPAATLPAPPTRLAAAAAPRARPHVAHPVAKPKAAASAAKVVKVAIGPAKVPAKPDAEPKVAIARAARPKPAAPQRPQAVAPPVVAEAPAFIPQGQPLPWSQRWMRSSLGMGQGGGR